jgi:hypothetical protein
MNRRFNREVSAEFVAAILAALADGPIGQELLSVAKGDREIVIVQSRGHEGWVVRTRAVEREAPGSGPVPRRSAAVDHDKQVATSSMVTQDGTRISREG